MRINTMTLRCLAVLVSQVLLPASTLVSTPLVLAAQVPGAEAAALMLPKVWQAGRSPVGFWVSEKFDGVRAVWDGTALRFRSGLPIMVPQWFTAALPKVALDGELWLGRGQFDRLSGLVRQSVPVDALWREVRYMVFDLPAAAGTFTDRIQALASVVQATGQPWLQGVVQQRVTTAEALQAQLKQVAAEGGEGLVLHHGDALWVAGRSDALLKFKPLPDEEARVVGHLPGKGRHAGRLGALLLVLPDGQQFALGTGFTDAQRESPPAIGSVVTYRYRDRTPKGLPRFASFLRVRIPE